jgi:hypothetical protein
LVRLKQHDSDLRAGRVFHRHGDGLGLLPRQVAFKDWQIEPFLADVKLQSPEQLEQNAVLNRPGFDGGSISWRMESCQTTPAATNPPTAIQLS